MWSTPGWDALAAEALVALQAASPSQCSYTTASVPSYGTTTAPQARC